ncbi:hypothetical protein [Thauera humireducens]|uniref:hypothetical protein n=1 Tax=Thauera humireducens TaxID=1134435 RepID=UPI00311EBFEA
MQQVLSPHIGASRLRECRPGLEATDANAPFANYQEPIMTTRTHFIAAALALGLAAAPALAETATMKVALADSAMQTQPWP